LFFESSPPCIPLLVKIGKYSSCNTERRRTKRNGRKKTLITVISDWGLDEIPKANNVVVFTILATVLAQSSAVCNFCSRRSWLKKSPSFPNTSQLLVIFTF
jgi:hypothetical protein